MTLFFSFHNIDFGYISKRFANQNIKFEQDSNILESLETGQNTCLTVALFMGSAKFFLVLGG